MQVQGWSRFRVRAGFVGGLTLGLTPVYGPGSGWSGPVHPPQLWTHANPILYPVLGRFRPVPSRVRSVRSNDRSGPGLCPVEPAHWPPLVVTGGKGQKKFGKKKTNFKNLNSKGPETTDVCNYCKEKGHWKNEWPKKKKQQDKSEALLL